MARDDKWQVIVNMGQRTFRKMVCSPAASAPRARGGGGLCDRCAAASDRAGLSHSTRSDQPVGREKTSSR